MERIRISFLWKDRVVRDIRNKKRSFHHYVKLALRHSRQQYGDRMIEVMEGLQPDRTKREGKNVRLSAEYMVFLF